MPSSRRASASFAAASEEAFAYGGYRDELEYYDDDDDAAASEEEEEEDRRNHDLSGKGGPVRRCVERSARLWRKYMDVLLVRAVLVAVSLMVVIVAAHIFNLGVVDRVGVSFHCVSPRSRAVAEALRPPPYAGNDSRRALLEQFAPVLFMHPDEKYMPTSLEDFVARSSLRAYRDEKVAVGRLTPAVVRQWMAVTPRTPVGPDSDARALSMVPEESALRGWRGNLSDVPYYGQARLVCIRPGATGGEIRETCDSAAEGLPAGPFGACDQTRSPGLRPTPGRFWELRYSFLSANNGPQYVLGFIPVGAHRGDLEHVTVRVASDRRTVIDVYYGTHTTQEGRWYHPRDLDWINGTHPAVFSALNSHASYPYCGTVRRRGFLRLAFPHDHTSDSGRVWWPRRVVSIDDCEEDFGSLLRDYTGDLGSPEVASITRQEWWCNEDDYDIFSFPYVVGV